MYVNHGWDSRVSPVMYLKQTFTILLCAIAMVLLGQQLEIEQPVRFLALGDSYTIGQSVPVVERWPEQLADSLEAYNYGVAEVKIIATTGWTTANLTNALNANTPDSNYTLVSLLIGVNNQFQGRDIDEYGQEFGQLLYRAIAHAGGVRDHVFVLSIPDYAFTPFGGGNQTVTEEIDDFNALNRQITEDLGVTYINITDISRRGLDEPELVASDGLHPSGLMYAEWVERILDAAGIGEVVSVDEPVLDDMLILFPNPVIDQLQTTIDYSSRFVITDVTGRSVLSGLVEPNAPINVSQLSPGLYSFNAQGRGYPLTTLFVKL